MTSEELERLAEDVATLDQCRHGYDLKLSIILKHTPALIAMAKWAKIARRVLVRIQDCGDANSNVLATSLIAAYPGQAS